jgi:hypothetical protein
MENPATQGLMEMQRCIKEIRQKDQLRRKRNRRLRFGLLFVFTFYLLSALSFVAIEASTTGKPFIQVVRHYLGMETAEVTITATPQLYLGELTATYISDSLVQLDWSVDGSVAQTMIRAKYDEAPSDITDGYQVYFNNGVQAFDTGTNLNETFSTIYYVAFPFDGGGNLLPAMSEATMESPHMAELALIFGKILIIAIIIALIVIAFWRNSIFLQIISGFSSTGAGIYWIAASSSLWYDVIIGVSFIAFGVYMMIMVGLDLIKNH